MILLLTFNWPEFSHKATSTPKRLGNAILILEDLDPAKNSITMEFRDKLPGDNQQSLPQSLREILGH